jgi:hypothetical protein
MCYGATYCFVAQLELEVHIDEPIYKNGAHAIGDISLRCHVVGTWLVLDLELAQVLVNVLDVLHDIVGLITIGSVDVKDWHCRSNLSTEKAFETAHKGITFSHTRAES